MNKEEWSEGEGLTSVVNARCQYLCVCVGGRRKGQNAPAKRTVTATPAFKKSAIFVRGTKYPRCAIRRDRAHEDEGQHTRSVRWMG